MADEKPPQIYLTFHFLDDVLLLPQGERYKKIDDARPNRIGPLVEYVWFDHVAGQSYLRESEAMEAHLLSRVIQTPASPFSRRTSLVARTVEFAKPPQMAAEFEHVAWIAFCKRLEAAIRQAGLPRRFAGQLAGTFVEMVSNLVEHSAHPETGIVGYKWTQGEFEYVVADNGIGLLTSLKTHRDYATLVDAGQALETALLNGESRHGKQAHRGTGFNTLVLNIASHKSYLRFRSNDHSHTIDGITPSPRVTTQLSSDFQGFLISVVSRT